MRHQINCQEIHIRNKYYDLNYQEWDETPNLEIKGRVVIEKMNELFMETKIHKNEYKKPQAYDFGSSPQFLYFYYPAVGIIGTNFPNFPYL